MQPTRILFLKVVAQELNRATLHPSQHTIQSTLKPGLMIIVNIPLLKYNQLIAPMCDTKILFTH